MPEETLKSGSYGMLPVPLRGTSQLLIPLPLFPCVGKNSSNSWYETCRKTAFAKNQETEVCMASFEELKAKYKSVLDVIQRQQVQVHNLHQQDGKLFIKGTAPSIEAANKVWDEIKRINPQLNDITADFPVSSSPQASQMSTYKVKQGDTLSKISKQFYGSSDQYMKIFEANKDQLTHPDKIQVGQELKIPAA
jgi:nucleoid-associated protein YgaU